MKSDGICTRRHVLTTSLIGLLCACTELKLKAQTAIEASSLGAAVNWNHFVERLEKSAGQQHQFIWDRAAYVGKISSLAKSLNLSDSRLVRWEKEYRDLHPGEPEFEDLLKKQDYQVTMVSFESGEFIPHHDHPQMTGVLLCAVGELSATNYDLVQNSERSGTCLLRQSNESVLVPGATSVLTDKDQNIHCVRAKTFTQVIDIFTPAYDAARTNGTRWYEVERQPAGVESDVFRARFSTFDSSRT